MEEFKHNNYTLQWDYIDPDTSISMGNGWTFTSESPDPVVREFDLEFQGYKFYTKVDEETGKDVIDETKNQYINNMQDLINFYLAHRKYKSFIFKPWGMDEEVIVRFKEFSVPRGIRGGGGALEKFNIKLVEKV